MRLPHTLGLALATCLQLVSSLYYDDDLYAQDLYKRLAELGAYQEVGPEDYYMDDISMDPRSHAITRDQEYEIGPIPDGFQYISGGAGEGQQHLTPEGSQNNTQEVKTDETLPFYCHPPNPCPKGFTAADGCDENITDTAESQKLYIHEAMKSGSCSCDEEHMFDCPATNDAFGSQKDDDLQDNLNSMIDGILQSDSGFGVKRDFIVAKKAPIMIKRSLEKLHQEDRAHLTAVKTSNSDAFFM